MALISQLSLDELAVNDDLWPTDSSVDQEGVDELVAECYDSYKPGSDLAKVRAAESSACEDDGGIDADGQPDVQPDCQSDQSIIAADLDKEGYEPTVLLDNKGDDDILEGDDVADSVHGLGLDRQRHVDFLRRGLKKLSTGFQCLDANRPWLCYYIVHGLCLLEAEPSADEKSHIVQFLARCQSPTGGFAGGPGQLSHLATTYSAVLTLSALGTKEAYDVVDREAMRAFLASLVTEDGGVCVHASGEADVRAAYCATAVAHVLNLDVWAAYRDVPFWLSQCQTYEGGFGGVRGTEAHGGYTYCAFAALCLLQRTDLADLEALAMFVSRRQMRLEGGFQGRTNKLVDACYSYWVGAMFPLLRRALNLASSLQNDEDSDEEEDDGDADKRHELPEDTNESLLCCPASLQGYLLTCCQYASGGLIDKPGKRPDFYHTCYALSGLSIMQHYAGEVCSLQCTACGTTPSGAKTRGSATADSAAPTTGQVEPAVEDGDVMAASPAPSGADDGSATASYPSQPAVSSRTDPAVSTVAQQEHQKNSKSSFVLGDTRNELVPVDPLLNICVDKAAKVLIYFKSLPVL